MPGGRQGVERGDPRVAAAAIAAYRAEHPSASLREIGRALGVSHTAVADALRGGRKPRPGRPPSGPAVGPPPVPYPAAAEAPRRAVVTVLGILQARAGELREAVARCGPAEAAALLRDAAAEVADVAEVLRRAGEGRPRRSA